MEFPGLRAGQKLLAVINKTFGTLDVLSEVAGAAGWWQWRSRPQGGGGENIAFRPRGTCLAAAAKNALASNVAGLSAGCATRSSLAPFSVSVRLRRAS